MARSKTLGGTWAVRLAAVGLVGVTVGGGAAAAVIDSRFVAPLASCGCS